jgi:hypothetical protein
MDEVLRKRLSAEELDRYDTYDCWASFASHLLVWPGIAAFLLFAAGQPSYALGFFLVAALALPVVVIMGRRAGVLRVAAEDRFAAIMGREAEDEADEAPARDRKARREEEKGP